MLSKVLQPKIVLYICFTYIFLKPATEFLHVLLLNNIVSYMKREISLDLCCVHCVDKCVSAKLEYCTRMPRKDTQGHITYSRNGVMSSQLNST